MPTLVPMDEKMAELHKAYDKHNAAEVLSEEKAMDGDTWRVHGCPCGCHFEVRRTWRAENIANVSVPVANISQDWLRECLTKMDEKWKESFYAFVATQVPGFSVSKKFTENTKLHDSFGQVWPNRPYHFPPAQPTIITQTNGTDPQSYDATGTVKTTNVSPWSAKVISVLGSIAWACMHAVGMRL